MSRIIFILLVVLLPFRYAVAALTIEITGGVEGAMPIAVIPFKWVGQGAAPDQDVADIIASDLRRSGRFMPLPRKDMIAVPSTPNELQFQNWRMLEIPHIVIGRMWNEGAGYKIEFRLFHVYQEKQIKGLVFPVKSPDQLRRTAHRIADVIFEELTGQRGAFDTYIAYIKQMPKTNPRPYGLYIADSDTANEQTVLLSRFPILSPTWSPDSTKLAFVKASFSGPAIYVLDIYSGKQERLTPAGVKVSSPAWSPDGRRMALMVYTEGNTDLYIMEVDTKKMYQFTQHWAIDTEPTWAPDGKSIVFTSERGGLPQLYHYFLETGDVKRLTFEGRQNLRASFSPDGTMITFVHLTDDRRFQIATMELASGAMRIVSPDTTDESEAESPSFAPNGSMIIYAANYKKKGMKAKRTALTAISMDGRTNQRFVDETGVGEVREPAWSSFRN